MVPGVQYGPSRKNSVTPAGVRTSKPLQSLMRAILKAPHSVGNPNKRGKGGSAGYMEWLAAKHPRIYVSLFIQLLPLLVAEHEAVAEGEKVRELLLQKIYRTIDSIEAEEAAEARGIGPNGPGDLASSTTKQVS
jgi:hypothetical protein